MDSIIFLDANWRRQQSNLKHLCVIIFQWHLLNVFHYTILRKFDLHLCQKYILKRFETLASSADFENHKFLHIFRYGKKHDQQIYCKIQTTQLFWNLSLSIWYPSKYCQFCQRSNNEKIQQNFQSRYWNAKYSKNVLWTVLKNVLNVSRVLDHFLAYTSCNGRTFFIVTVLKNNTLLKNMSPTRPNVEFDVASKNLKVEK